MTQIDPDKNAILQSALHTALDTDDVATVATLLEQMDDWRTWIGSDGRPLLQLACAMGSLKVATHLLTRGALLNSPTLDGRNETALHSFLRGKGASDAEFLETLVRHGAELNSADAAGETPLHIAVTLGMASSVRLLASEGADPLLKNARGLTSLEAAKVAGREDLAKMISPK